MSIGNTNIHGRGRAFDDDGRSVSSYSLRRVLKSIFQASSIEHFLRAKGSNHDFSIQKGKACLGINDMVVQCRIGVI